MAVKSFRDIRKGLGLSQMQVARAAKVTRVYYTQIENGQRTPNPNVLKSIADTLGLTLDDAFVILNASRRVVTSNG